MRVDRLIKIQIRIFLPRRAREVEIRKIFGEDAGKKC
jgi:hypothetical protein